MFRNDICFLNVFKNFSFVIFKVFKYKFRKGNFYLVVFEINKIVFWISWGWYCIDIE